MIPIAQVTLIVLIAAMVLSLTIVSMWTALSERRSAETNQA